MKCRIKNKNKTVVILTTVILLLLTTYIPSSYSLGAVAPTAGGAFRKSTLLSWDGKVVLGHCVEERSSVSSSSSAGYDGISTLRITTIVHDDDLDDGSSKHKKENDDDNEVTDTDTSPLVLQFPEKEDNTGSLASQHCMSAFASAILTRSSNFQAWMAEGKTIVELGSGRGAAGVAAAAKSSHCVLTEYDDEAIQLLQATIQLNKDNAMLQATTLTTDFLDWREDYHTEDLPPVDLVVGSDIAYYYHLLRPIMDTSRTFMDRRRPRDNDTDNTTNNTNKNDDTNNKKKKNDQVDNTINSNKSSSSTSSSSSSTGSSRRGSSFFVVGQANRQSQLDLFTNIKNGCYNQLTDQQDPPWTGTTTMLLYQLQISEFCATLLECDTASKVDGVIPISVIVHHDNDDDTDNDNNNDDSVTKLQLRPFDHHAYEVTEEECKSIPKTF